MKKFFSFICLFLICFILLGCKKTEVENEDGKVTIINVNELLDIYDLDKNILYATLNKSDENYDKLYTTLKDFAKQTKNDIYLIDTSNINLVESEYIDILTDNDSTLSYLYGINKGTLELSISIPLNVNEIINAIGNKKYDKVDIAHLLYMRDTNYNDGFELLAEGRIGESYAKVYSALPKEEAKMLLEEENLYNILNYWETTIKKGDNCTYLSLNFTMKSDKLYRSYYNGKCSDLIIENLKLEAYDYYTDGKTIYTKEPLEDEYSKKYTIVKLDKDKFKIKTSQREYDMTIFEGDKDL